MTNYFEATKDIYKHNIYIEATRPLPAPAPLIM